MIVASRATRRQSFDVVRPTILQSPLQAWALLEAVRNSKVEFVDPAIRACEAEIDSGSPSIERAISPLNPSCRNASTFKAIVCPRYKKGTARVASLASALRGPPG